MPKSEAVGGGGGKQPKDQVCNKLLAVRVADPVHFRSDPVNQNFKIGSWILLAPKESIQTSKFFFTSNIFLLIFEWLLLSEKMEKFTWKCVKPLFWKYFFLVYITLHCQCTDRIRIRIRIRIPIRWKISGSDQKGPDPQPCLQLFLFCVGSQNAVHVNNGEHCVHIIGLQIRSILDRIQ